MRVLKRHDAYVLRAFWGAFGGVLVFFTLMTIVIDMAERFKQVRENWSRVRESGYEPLVALVELYATFVPFLWLRILPVAAPMAGAFALVRLTRHQELVPLVAGGVSTRRLLMPMLLSGAFLAVLLFGARATVMADLNREHQLLERLFTKRQPDRVVENVRHVHDGLVADGLTGRLSIAAYNPLARKLEDAWIVRRAADGSLVEARRYPELVWDDAQHGWYAPKGGTRVPLDAASAGLFTYPLAAGERAPLASTDTLLEVLFDADNSLGTSLSESRELLRTSPDSPGVILRYQEQFTLPLSVLALLAITLPLCLRLARHDPLPGLLYALGIGTLYFAAGQTCNDLALSGEINPAVLAWLPTIAFGSLGTALYAGMKT